MKKIVTLIAVCAAVIASAQNNASYWQQHVDYKMDVNIDVKNYQYQGTQQLVYTNNSPDVLEKVFYHLYFNAFQPGSEMDERLKSVIDPDSRMIINVGTLFNPKYESRISRLKPNEIGYLNVLSLKHHGISVPFTTKGTVMEVVLNTPIQPGEKVTFEMIFEGQIPVHIRRAGRNNKNGVALSMAQWYPKIAGYDFEGWHADPYIGREFYGVWGNFDVTLHIDRTYTVGGTGYLQNPQEIGHGYEDQTKKLNIKKGEKLSWHFVAPNVHDFTWAADPEYVHDIRETTNGTTLHFFYKKAAKYKKAWKEVQPLTEKALDYFNEEIGKYPYEQYSVIQGGDGGMEYAMCTLIAGGETLKGLKGTVFHELAHSWFHHLLANNESKYSWMDEGFASYFSGRASSYIQTGRNSKPLPGSYEAYYYGVKNGLEEPLTTHADRFYTNKAFVTGSYTKGRMFLSQLNYIIGEDNVRKTIKKYFNDFKFKHPRPNDIKRTAEKVSGMQLDWYLNEWIETTNTIDYAVAKVEDTLVTLARVGKMPMPLDLTVTYVDGTSEEFNIPLRMMWGSKPTKATVLKDWPWAHPTYTFSTNKKIQTVLIDPLGFMADIDKSNNSFFKKQ